MILSYYLPLESSSAGADLTVTGVVAGWDTLRIPVVGEIDIATAPRFADAVTDMLHRWPHRRVCVDLASVRFLDSSGIKALLDCRRRAGEQGRELVIAAAQPIVRRVLQITGVLDLLAPAGAEDTQAAPPGHHR